MRQASPSHITTEQDVGAPCGHALCTATLPSYRRALAEKNLSPRTVRCYLDAVCFLGAYLEAQGMPTDLATIAREHLESYLIDDLERHAPSTVGTHFRALKRFFAWAIEEGEVKDEHSPMRHLKAPREVEQMPHVLTDDQQRAVLAACEGSDFADKRDAAILAVLLDAGLRKAELLGLRYAPGTDQHDLFLDRGAVRVIRGKGGRERLAGIGRRTVRLLDRYIRARERHPDHRALELWLGHKGPLGERGIFQIVRSRGRQAGIANLYPHALRHAAAHNLLAAGMGETNVMRLLGWRTSRMLLRYAASTGQDRALAAHKELSPLDKVLEGR